MGDNPGNIRDGIAGIFLDTEAIILHGTHVMSLFYSVFLVSVAATTQKL